MNTWRDKLTYQFDKLIRKDIYAQILGLTVLVFLFALLGGLLVGAGEGLINAPANVWWAFLRIVDTGHLGEDKDFWKESVAFLVTLGGLFVFGALVTIMNNAFSQRIETLKKGKIKVIEKDHTIILGWGSTVFSVIEELIRGADQEREAVSKIVILADKNRDEMYAEVYQYCFSEKDAVSVKKRAWLKNVICRTGKIESYADMDMIGMSTANKVIILSNEANPNKELEDAKTVKALFTTVQDYKRNKVISESKRKPVICLSVNNTVTAKTLQVLQSPDLNINVSSLPDLLGRMIAQITLSPYLRDVYEDLLDYEGNEIYSYTLKGIRGLSQENASFDTIYNALPNAIPIGYESAGQVRLNPKGADATKILSPDDSLIIVSESKDGLAFLKPAASVLHSPVKLPPHSTSPVSILIIGQGQKVNSIIKHLINLVPSGSTIYHTSNRSFAHRDNIAIEFIQSPNNIEEHYQLIEKHMGVNMLVLADDENNREIHDSQVLLKITAAKKIYQTGNSKCLIVAEFLDPRNADLASIVGVEVYVVSTKLASNYLVQVVNEPDRKVILDQMLNPGSDDLCIRPLNCYVDSAAQASQQKISFARLMQLARIRGDIAIGYIDRETKKSVLNPKDRTALRDIEAVVIIGKQDDGSPEALR